MPGVRVVGIRELDRFVYSIACSYCRPAKRLLPRSFARRASSAVELGAVGSVGAVASGAASPAIVAATADDADEDDEVIDEVGAEEASSMSARSSSAAFLFLPRWLSST